MFKGWILKKVFDLIYTNIFEKLWGSISSWSKKHFKRKSKHKSSYRGKRTTSTDKVRINGSTFDPYDYANWVGDGYPNNHQRVKDLQVSLSQAYYNPGVIDGIWGPKTKSALIHMQQDRGLSAEGVCSTATWKVLSK